MMRQYELTVVFSPQLNQKDLTAAAAAVENLVEKAKGKIKKMEDWGKKVLSYPIKKEVEGVYQWRQLELPTAAVANVDKELKLQQQILRYLLVVNKD